jgi:hypothetical protein
MTTNAASMTRHERRKANTAQRNAQITTMFSELYHKNRVRLDDVIDTLSSRFALSGKTIERILSKKR